MATQQKNAKTAPKKQAADLPQSTLQVGQPMRYIHNGTKPGWADELPALVARVLENEAAELVVFNRAIPSEATAALGEQADGIPYYLPVDLYMSSNEMKAINIMLDKMPEIAGDAIKDSELKGDKKEGSGEGQNGAGEKSETK